MADQEAISIDEGFVLAELDKAHTPDETLTPIDTELTLTAFAIPEASELTAYVIYDADGNRYPPGDLQSIVEGPVAERVHTLLEDVRGDDTREKRLALYGIAEIASGEPELVIDAIPFLTEALEASEPDVRAMALEALATMGETYPGHVTPASESVIARLDPASDARLRADAVGFVASVAEHDPAAVVDAAPTLAVLVQDDTEAASRAIVALSRIAKRHPEAVAPAAAVLQERVADEDAPQRVGALAALGQIAKSYPDIAESTISIARDLLDTESDRLRSNAAALFADFAETEPERVRSVVPKAIELLDDTDERARYNATSILARVAEPFPDDVEQAIDPLVGTLEEEFEFTRSNACWALGYLEAERALPELENLAESDPSENVRNAADVAVDEIRDGDD